VVETLAGFIKEGKFSHIGLSEVTAGTIKKAIKVHPITTVEVEFSLWSIDILTNGVFEICQQNNIAIVAYSPLGRGILSGKWEKSEDVPKSLREQYPRYADENFEDNKKFLDYVKFVAEKKNASPAQIALKWVLMQGKGVVIPIPGATREERVKENCAAADVELTKEEFEEMNNFVQTTEVKGARYNAEHMKLEA
jgi:pyridoxine 4-dehydrogenase